MIFFRNILCIFFNSISTITIKIIIIVVIIIPPSPPNLILGSCTSGCMRKYWEGGASMQTGNHKSPVVGGLRGLPH